MYNKKSSIISVGTELTEGVTQDVHLKFLGSELKVLGLPVTWGLHIPDEWDVFCEELKRSLELSDLVIVTGGLGPTTDDITREAVSEVVNRSLVFHDYIWREIQERFHANSESLRKIPQTNKKQALIPDGFGVIDNPRGTAPGFAGSVGDSYLVALPGPPSELKDMFTTQVRTLLSSHFAFSGAEKVLVGTALMVSESLLEETFRRFACEALSWATRVEYDRIVFRICGGGLKQRSDLFHTIQDNLGAARIREGDETPAQLLSDALLTVRGTLVTVESCTGGLLGKLMTDNPGSSRVYKGGFVVYSNEAKESVLCLEPSIISDYGSVSKEVVHAMAKQALERSRADLSIAVSGIAGPDGGTSEKPVGTVCMSAQSGGDYGTDIVVHFRGSRDVIRKKTAVAAFILGEHIILKRSILDKYFSW